MLYIDTHAQWVSWHTNEPLRHAVGVTSACSWVKSCCIFHFKITTWNLIYMNDHCRKITTTMPVAHACHPSCIRNYLWSFGNKTGTVWAQQQCICPLHPCRTQNVKGSSAEEHMTGRLFHTKAVQLCCVFLPRNGPDYCSYWWRRPNFRLVFLCLCLVIMASCICSCRNQT